MSGASSVADGVTGQVHGRLGTAPHLEFRQDVGYVVSNRLFSEPELGSDLSIRHARGDQLQNALLTRRKALQPLIAHQALVLAQAVEDLSGDERIEKASAGSELSNSAHQVIPTDLLEDVPSRTGHHRREQRFIVGKGSKHENLHLWHRGSNRAGRFDAALVGEANVHDDDVGSRPLGFAQGSRRRVRLADHDKVRGRGKKCTDTTPHDLMVIDQEYPDSCVRVVSHPSPSRDAIRCAADVSASTLPYAPRASAGADDPVGLGPRVVPCAFTVSVRWRSLRGGSVAVSRARPARRVDRDLRAIGGLTQAVLDGDDLEGLLGRIAVEAQRLVGAASAVVATVAGTPGVMTVRGISGPAGDGLRVGSRVTVLGSLAEDALVQGSVVVAQNAAAGNGFGDSSRIGPLVAAPLTRAGSAYGVILVSNPEGSEPFKSPDIELVATFASQAASAIELNELRAAEQLFIVAVERERIARDLHDGVIQSLYGLGMSLRALAGRTADPVLASGIHDALIRLDEAIQTVRWYIGELKAKERREPIGRPRPGRHLTAEPLIEPSSAMPRRVSGDAVAAIGVLARASATDRPIAEVLADLVAGVVERCDAGFAVVGTMQDDGEELLVRARSGPSMPGRRVGDRLPIRDTVAGEAIRLRRPLVLARLEDAGRSVPKALRHLVGPMVATPLIVRGRAFGAMAVGRPSDGSPFSRLEVSMIEAYGVQAAIALEFDRVRQELRGAAVSAERRRIGRDLHEQVIQLLFGVGLALQGLESAARDASARAGLRSSVDGLDRAIRDLRRYVFDLGPSAIVDRPLHEELSVLASDLIVGAGIELDLDIDPAVSSLLAGGAADVVHIAREALSNVARHAGARRCGLRVVATDGRVTLEVTDDGVGLGNPVSGSGQGLSNIRTRAASLGGQIQINGLAGSGTTVRLVVPV
jgi:signal transduction histidine kinase